MLDCCITGILGLNAEATESRACRLPANPPAKSKTAGFFLRGFIPRSISRFAKRFQRRRGKDGDESEHGSAPLA